MNTEEKTKLQEYVDGLDLTYTATFQPTLQPADKVKSPQLHWLIGLGRGRNTMSCTYHEGMAHVVGYQQYHKSQYEHRQYEECYRRTCETGKLYRRDEHSLHPWETPKKQPAPSLIDVLYCLVSDASVLDYSNYEDWASEYGYDEDSRKGELIYRECISQSLALRKVLGDKHLEMLTELFQDY